MPPAAGSAARRPTPRGCAGPPNGAPQSSRSSPATATNPEVGRREEIALATCFHRLAEQERELVCSMNLGFLTGLLEGPAACSVGAREPRP